MRRVLTTISWAMVALAIAVAVASPLLGTPGAYVELAVLVSAAIPVAFAAGRASRVPVLPLTVLGASAVHMLTAEATSVPTRLVDSGWPLALAGAAATLLLAFGLIHEFGERGARASHRDLLDALMALVSGGVVAWILIAEPLLDERGMPVALTAAQLAYVPLTVLIAGLVVLLAVRHFPDNRATQFAALAVAAVIAGHVTRAAVTATDGTGAVDVATATYLAGVLLASAAFVHPTSLRAPVQLHIPTRRHGPAIRFGVLVGLLLVPAVLLSAVPADDTRDRLVRTTAAVLLLLLGAARLLQAFRMTDRAELELLARTHRDELTGLPNRRQLVESIEAALDSTWRTDERPALMQLNLDRFENISDTLGHAAANEALTEVAHRLAAASSRADASVARTAGDEFVILLASTASATDAVTAAEAIRAELDRPIAAGDTEIFLTASTGLVVAPRNRTITPDEFLRRVDIATHQAKLSGRNRMAVFDDSMQASLTLRMEMEHALHGALGRHEMELYHQPIVDIETGKICGFEALARWRRDNGSAVAPTEFVPIAEETGLINAIGSWALVEALRDLRRWLDDGTVDPSTTMSVNVSPRQIADPHFPELVHEALEITGVPPHLLWLEVTESMMLSEPELARTTLRKVREMGVHIALDDFGTGYSSLSLLQRFPLQRIKIDREFVHGVADRSNDRSLVRTIIAMGRSLGLDVVAEGVESIHQLRTLHDLGCSKAQGYLISHPVPGDAIRSTMVALQDLGALEFFGRGSTEPATEAPPVRSLGTTR